MRTPTVSPYNSIAVLCTRESTPRANPEIIVNPFWTNSETKREVIFYHIE